MSNANDNDLPTQDELETLKARAAMLGVKHHPSIGVEALREKVAAAQAGKPAEPDTTPTAPAAVVTPLVASADPAADAPVAAAPETEAQKRMRRKNEALKLVRIRVTCMNPAKKEWEGEIFTAGNAAIGSVKKFVPFNADDGWHVQHIIYQMMLDRMCQVFSTVTDDRGNKVRRGKLIREFAIEVMPQLTQDELDELARRQAMAKSID